jgi:cytochrome c biogenesis protein CcmG, thiol:disulfide interchange protein DsbE
LRCVVFGGLLMLACPLGAAALKLESLQVGPRTYRQVNILGANATDLFFTYDKGIANVKLRLLSPELQKQFNYDPQSAADAEKKQFEEDALFQATLKSNLVAQAQKVAEAARKTAATSEESLADPLFDNSLLGKPAPSLEVEKWLSEKPVLEGKYALIFFWTPWSIPCRKSIPEMNALQKKFADKLVIAGMTSESESDITEMEGPKLEFASAIDAKARVLTAAGLTSVPSVLLLDPKGIILYLGHPGAITEKKLQGILAKAAQ